MTTAREIGKTDHNPARRRERMLREITPHMHVYETKLPHSPIRPRNAGPVDSSEKIIAYLEDAIWETPCWERVWIVSIDRWGQPISRILIALGTLTGTLAHPGEVFRVAMLAKAAGIVLVRHRHSGDPAPSRADHALAAQLYAAAKSARTRLVDQVIGFAPDSMELCRHGFRFAMRG